MKKDELKELSKKLGITDFLREKTYIKDEEAVQDIINRCGFRAVKETMGYLRGTGRSTRLIEDAIANFIEGKNVIVYTHSSQFNVYLFNIITEKLVELLKKGAWSYKFTGRVHKIIGTNNNAIELRVLDRDTWERILKYGFDGCGWYTNNQRCDVILVDHQPIENKIGHIIEHWFSYLLKEKDGKTDKTEEAAV